MDLKYDSFQASRRNREFLHSLPAAVGFSDYTTNDLQRLAKKSHLISESVTLAASIDNLLHAHRSDTEFVSIGKYSIATCIIQSENNSSLSYTSTGRGHLGFSSRKSELQPANSWLGTLTKTLSAGRDFKEFCDAISSISFVCFNYDRCIERYLSGAASLLYPSGDFSFDALEESLDIIHPYGSLGDLRPNDGEYGTFGKLDDQRFLVSASKNIRTFTEGMKSDVRKKISYAFSSASSAIFLGYGFISVNDQFLFDEGPFENKSVLGTVYGISEERTAAISDRLANACMMIKTPYDGWQQRGKPLLRNEGCADLIHRFSHVIERIGQ